MKLQKTGGHKNFQQRIDLDEEPSPTITSGGIGGTNYELQDDNESAGKEMPATDNEEEGILFSHGWRRTMTKKHTIAPTIQGQGNVTTDAPPPPSGEEGIVFDGGYEKTKAERHTIAPTVINRPFTTTVMSRLKARDARPPPSGEENLLIEHHVVAPTIRQGQPNLKTNAEPPVEGMLPNPLVPTMVEINAMPDNGLRVVSTFTGCGGSCLGFRWAGFRPLWASEFVPMAAKTYKLNHPGVPVDSRDIRDVTPEEILDVIGLAPGELDVLEGSPPCASFSMAGKRDKKWGKVSKYSDTKQRTDDLMFEFVRILTGLQPKVFVAENVKGLVMGTAKGYFIEIFRAMEAAGYKVSCRVLDAQYLGVPQHRERAIFIGVREDLGIKPSHPKPQTVPMPLADAMPWIRTVQYNHIPGYKAENVVDEDAAENISPTILAGGARKEAGGYCEATPSISAIGTAPPHKEWVASGETADERQDAAMVDAQENVVPSILASGVNKAAGLCEAADISRYQTGKQWDKLKPGEKAEGSYPVKKPALDEPSDTILQSSGAYPSNPQGIHPTEKRKFTIAELRIICGFPEDFILPGTYAQQWERLGRAVPPPMMKAVAEHIRDHILKGRNDDR